MKIMSYKGLKYILLWIVATALCTSCMMDANDVDEEELNQEVLDGWMQNNVDDLADYYSAEDGYYAKVTKVGTGTPIYQYDDCWVKYNLTGYNLSGNICVTRNEVLAYQLSTFDTWVRYNPLYQDLHYDEDDYYDLDTFDYLPECLNLAFKDETLALQKGAELTMYIPYDLIDGASTSTSSYVGQFSLLAYQPLLAQVEITDIIADPVQDELTELEKFLALNGGVLVNYRESDGEDIEDEEYEEYNIAQEQISQWWSNALDTVANVYLHRHYTPDISYTYIDEYTSQVPDCIYTDYTMKEIDAMIKTLIEDEDDEYDQDFQTSILTQDFISFSGTANVWYIGRFLDGFIFDTNIPALKDFINYSSGDTSTYLEYRASTAYSTYIYAWYYAMPHIRYGQWATIITTSEQGYGEVTLQDDIPAYSTMLFHIYVERQYEE